MILTIIITTSLDDNATCWLCTCSILFCFYAFKSSFDLDYETMHDSSIHLLFFSRALATLDQTRKDAIIIKDVITQTREKLEVATVESADLLKVLTSKATSLEKLKAKLGIGSSTLSAFTAMIDSEIEEEDNTLLVDDDEDELDEEFEKIKNAKMKSRQIKVIEEIATAEVSVQEAKVQLKKAEQLVRLTCFD